MKSTTRGTVTRLLKQFASGFVLTESGDEVFFGPYALDGIGIDDLKEGQRVEVELRDFGSTIKRLRPECAQRSETYRCA